jgi:hypothetical protein
VCGVQILSFATGMLDYVIVARLNIKAGISDKAFVLGDEVRHSPHHPSFSKMSHAAPDNLARTHGSG